MPSGIFSLSKKLLLIVSLLILWVLALKAWGWWSDTFFIEKRPIFDYMASGNVLSEGVYYVSNKGWSVKDRKEMNRAIVISKALEWGIDVKLALDLVKCESNFNSEAIGDKGRSFGLWQLHLPAHPQITKEQALNPEWSTDWAMERLKEGKFNMWTCFKIAAKAEKSNPNRPR